MVRWVQLFHEEISHLCCMIHRVGRIRIVFVFCLHDDIMTCVNCLDFFDYFNVDETACNDHINYFVSFILLGQKLGNGVS